MLLTMSMADVGFACTQILFSFSVVVFGTCHCRCAIVRQTQIDMINKNKQWFGGTTNAVCVSTQKDVRKDSN